MGEIRSKMFNAENVQKVKISFPEQNKFFLSRSTVSGSSISSSGSSAVDNDEETTRIWVNNIWPEKVYGEWGYSYLFFKEIYFYCHIVFGGVGRTRYPLMRVCLAVVTARSVNDRANWHVDLLLLFLFRLLLLLISAKVIILKLAASCDDPRTWRHHFLVLQSQHFPGKRFSSYFIITFPTDERR